MGIFSHIHRLLCRHCRHAKPLQCPLKAKKTCRDAKDKTAQQKQSRYPPRDKRRSDRAARLILLCAKTMLERKLAKYSDSDLEEHAERDERDERDEQHWELLQNTLEDEQIMPFDILTELSGESQRTVGEPDFCLRLDELPAVVPTELPTNIHWTETDDDDHIDSTESTDSIGIAQTTAGRVRTPPHARPFSLPANYATCYSFSAYSTSLSYTQNTAYPTQKSNPGTEMVHAKSVQALRQVRRKSIGSPRNFYNLDSEMYSDISISSTLSVGTATVEHITPSAPTVVTVKPVRRRPVSASVESSSLPECLEAGPRPSYRSSASRSHSVRTRRSLPQQLPRPLILPTIIQSAARSRSPSPTSLPTEADLYKGSWKSYSDLGGYPTLRSSPYPSRYSDPNRFEKMARYKKPLPLLPTTRPTRAAPIVPYQPMPREMRLFLGMEPEATEEAKKAEEEAKREKREARMREVRALIEARSKAATAAAAAAALPQRRQAPTTFDEILARPQMPTLRRSSTAVAYSPSAGAAGQLLLTSVSPPSSYEQASPSYDSIEGRRLLHSLCLFMGIPAAWSSVQTLLYILHRTRTRSLRISRSSELINRINGLSWRGVLAHIGDPVSFERAGRLIYCGEALFTNKTCVHSFLLKKDLSKRPLGKAMKQLSTMYIKTMWTQWNIEFNPRRRYHQCWTGAGPSRLSGCTVAE